jgi:cell division protein FtsQ
VSDAFSRRRRARRLLSWRRALAALTVVGLLALGGYAVWFSPWLSAEDVRITGTAQLDVAEVERVAGVPLGEPLARVDLAAVRARVGAMAMVEAVDVTRSWPHEVRIAVTEREAVAVVQVGTGLRGMDASGVLFRDFATAPAGLPRVQVETGTTAEALSEAAAVIAALPPDLATTVDHVQVASVDQIELALRDGRQVLWGSAEESEQKAEVLAVLLGEDARVYDVSVPSNPTTRQ